MKHHCKTHGEQGLNTWGCPECVKELREGVPMPTKDQIKEWLENEYDIGADHMVYPDKPSDSFLGYHLDSMPRIVQYALRKWGSTTAVWPVCIKRRLPDKEDVEEKTGYCWWFNVDQDTWLYGDASSPGYPWLYWLPYWARPLPPGSWIRL